MSGLKQLVVLFIRFYQLAISPVLPASCRFYPTCSEYSLTAVREYGVMRGLWMSIRRILRCGPWHPGGYDPVPVKK